MEEVLQALVDIALNKLEREENRRPRYSGGGLDVVQKHGTVEGLEWAYSLMRNAQSAIRTMGYEEAIDFLKKIYLEGPQEAVAAE